MIFVLSILFFLTLLSLPFLPHHRPPKAGRLVDTKPTQTTATNYVFQITSAGSVKHVTVFMTGAAPFTAGL